MTWARAGMCEIIANSAAKIAAAARSIMVFFVHVEDAEHSANIAYHVIEIRDKAGKLRKQYQYPRMGQTAIGAR